MIRSIISKLKSRLVAYGSLERKLAYEEIGETVHLKRDDVGVKILIEGMLRTPKNNLEKIIVAKAVGRIYGLSSVDVLTKRSLDKSDPNADFYKASGVKVAARLEAGIFDVKIVIKSIMLAIRLRKQFFSKDFVDFNFKGIPLGELVCDTAIRNFKGIYTYRDINWSQRLKLLLSSSYYISFYESVLSKERYDYLIISHKSYLVYGVIFYLARFNGIKVLLRDNNVIKLYDENVNAKEHFLQISHDKIREHLGNPNSLVKSNDYIESRFKGEVDQIDVNNAFNNKTKYSKHVLFKELNLDNNKPVVLIMPHAFSDSPHCGTYLAFEDYYHWLECVVEAVSKNNNCNFLIKPHPSSYFWGERGIVEELMARASNIVIVPGDMNTNSFVGLADIVITAQGTIGLESICFNIPSLTCGGSYYSGNFEDLEFKDRDDYLTTIVNLGVGTIPRVNDEQARLARITLWLSHTSLVNSTLVAASNILPNEDYSRQEKKLLSEIVKKAPLYKVDSDPLFIAVNEMI